MQQLVIRFLGFFPGKTLNLREVDFSFFGKVVVDDLGELGKYLVTEQQKRILLRYDLRLVIG